MNSREAGRRSIRLRDVSYAEAGWYFVTLCTAERECSLAEFTGGEMRLTDIGRIVQEEWERTAVLRRYVELDAFVVMPNHVHGVIGIVGGEQLSEGGGCRGVRPYAPTGRLLNGTEPASLGAIVQNFKAVVTRRVNEMRGTPSAALWQRNYYEHVVRGARDLERIRRYIAENPRRWVEDRYYGEG